MPMPHKIRPDKRRHQLLGDGSKERNIFVDVRNGCAYRVRKLTWDNGCVIVEGNRQNGFRSARIPEHKIVFFETDGRLHEPQDIFRQMHRRRFSEPEIGQVTGAYRREFGWELKQKLAETTMPMPGAVHPNNVVPA